MKFKILIMLCVTTLMFSGAAIAGSHSYSDASASASSSSSAVVNAGDQVTNQAQGLENINLLDNVGGIKDSFNSDSKRGFVIPGEVDYGPIMNYFGKSLPSAGFQPIEDIILYQCWYTEGALISMLKNGGGHVRAKFELVDNRWSAQPNDKSTKWIKIVIGKRPWKYVGKAGNARQTGFVTSESEDEDTNMRAVVAGAALEAMHNKCNVIHFSAQGAVRDAFSTGWGIGLHSTAAVINNADNDRSAVGGGGTGYSSAHAGTRDLPWAQAYGLADPDLVPPQSEAAQVIN